MVTVRKLVKIATSDPIVAGGNGPLQRARRASSKPASSKGIGRKSESFGRGSAICENDKIMQISPLEPRRTAYKSVQGLLQYQRSDEPYNQN
jgi:hypothetical protein